MDEHSCYGCIDVLGEHRNDHHDVLFTDSRTGRRFCHECIACLVSWELDGCPEADDPDCSYPEWVGATPAEDDQPKRTQLHIGNPMCVCSHMRDEHDEQGDCQGEWRGGVCFCDAFDGGDDADEPAGGASPEGADHG